MKILTENYLKSLEKEILTENYSDLFDKVYSDFRKEQSEFKTEIIEIGKIYYRARVGNDTMEAAIDDLNIISKIPYFGNNMDKPPARFVQEEDLIDKECRIFILQIMLRLVFLKFICR